jgi:hypothetical protein
LKCTVLNNVVINNTNFHLPQSVQTLADSGNHLNNLWGLIAPKHHTNIWCSNPWILSSVRDEDYSRNAYLSSISTLENTKGAIINGQSRET